MKYDLGAIEQLKHEATENGFRLGYEQVYVLLKHLEVEKARYEGMIDAVRYFLGKNPDSNASQMIGPFLKMAADTLAREVVGEE